MAGRRAQLYRTIWRWHFYAGLFVMPFVMLLSMTGAVYLFKPQIDRWEERAFRGLQTIHPANGDQQVAQALAHYPGAVLDSYRLPIDPGDAALISIQLSDSRKRDVFVSPQGKVLGDLDPEHRITALVFALHGELLLGQKGAWLVELAGSWAIVMILTGLFLWWPAGRGAAGVIWPRLSLGRRAFWRDLHAVTGFWVSGFALILLVTGLPWTGVWGSGFAALRAQTGLVKSAPDWAIGSHDHMATVPASVRPAAIPISAIIAKAKAFNLAFPALIRPPGGPDAANNWSVKSESQNRPLRVTLKFDAATGRLALRTGFADSHPIDRAVGYGVAWHEGQLFGWINQLAGLLTAIALIVMMVSGFVLWRRRKPAGGLGAPAPRRVPARIGGVAIIILILATLLPMLALSLIAVVVLENMVFSRVASIRNWLGIKAAGHQSPDRD